MKLSLFAIGALLGWAFARCGAATFSIDNIHVYDRTRTMGNGIVVQEPSGADIFIPQVEVNVRVSEDAQSKNLLAKAYFFDEDGQLIQTCDQPAFAVRIVPGPTGPNLHFCTWPTIIPANVRQSIYFPLPKSPPPNWKLVVVFGNANGVVTASDPGGQDQTLSYPEQDLAAKTLLNPDVKLTDDRPTVRLIEQKVDSNNPRYPAFTLLMHLPHGITNPKDVSGVLATCIVADSVEQIRDRLNAIQPEGDSNPYFAFAEKHNMAIIAWGSRWVWNSYANFDELDQNQIHSWDDNFQQLADAWDRGIELLVHNYGIPDHDYLMYGLCSGGEWAHRLALHKPGRFLAVQMHISTSYDAPEPEASHILWLLTTGELDSGCDRARRFYSAAREMGYPIIFKSVIGLNHADSPVADDLGISFFEYALAEKAKRDAANGGSPSSGRPIGLSGFDPSPFYGDLMNQDMFEAKDKQLIPAKFLVPLPTRQIAEAWNK